MIYTERLSSHKTQALFLGLTLLFLLLLAWRVSTFGFGVLAIVFLSFFIFFLFYTVNYSTLIIQLTVQHLKLKFGIFTWIVPLENIANCRLDELPALSRFGGAGIHFMVVDKRYRASFNFLEYPRLVVALKRKVGPVRDISFSTRRPQEVLHLIQGS